METQLFQGSPTLLSVSLTDESELMFVHFSPESNTTPKHEDHKFRGNLGYIVTHEGLLREFKGNLGYIATCTGLVRRFKGNLGYILTYAGFSGQRLQT